MKIRIEDLPESLQRQVRAQIAAEDARRGAGTQGGGCVASEAAGASVGKPDADKRSGGAVSRVSSEPNKTEAEYNRLHLGGVGKYEPITLRLPGGSRYTPDWMTVEDGVTVLHEVKGGYRLHSHGRALTAFREAVAAFPCFRFVWARRDSAGWWDIKTFQNGGNHA